MNRLLAFLFLTLQTTPLTAQTDEPFHFDGAPRWYDLLPNGGRPDAGDMVAFDYDGDGDVDVVRVLANKLEYASASGDGLVYAGTFTTAVQGYLALNVEAGDFNGDGTLDLAVAGKRTQSPYTGVVQILLGSGAGSFAPVLLVDLPWSDAFILGLAAGDIDADGIDDIAVAERNSSEVHILRSSGATQTFATPFVRTLQQLQLGDLNGDGRADLVLLEHASNLSNASVSVRITLPSGALPTSDVVYPVAAVQPYGLELADVDHDGDLDVATTEGSVSLGATDLILLPNMGAGALGAELRSNLLSNTWYAADLEFDDLDGDGAPDLALSCLQYQFGPVGVLVVANGDGAGGFVTTSSYSLPAGSVAIDRAGPVGTQRILTAAGHIVPIGRRGDIELQGIEYGTVYDPPLQALLDFDRDGIVDVALYDTSSASVRVYFSDGEGGFASVNTIAFVGSQGAFNMEAADVDGDGWTDIVLQSPFVIETVRNVLGTSATVHSTDLSALGAACSLENYATTVGDIDGDGRADLLRVSRHFPDALLARGKSDATFDPQCLNLNDFAGGVAIGDVNGDGVADIVFVSRGDGGLTVLPGTGSTPPFGALLHTKYLENLTGGLTLGDIDRDGDLDVATSTGSKIVLLTGDGLGHFVLAQALSVKQGRWLEPQLADFDGDGWLDLVARHENAVASFRVFRNVVGNFEKVGPGWDFCAGGAAALSVATIDVGDLDADGYLDVVAGGYQPDSGLARPLVFANRSTLRGSGVASAGGTVALELNMPSAPSAIQVLLASAHGTWPGLAVGGVALPLNDSPALFDFVLAGGGGVFVGFVGALDGAGRGVAHVAVPTNFGVSAPLRIDFACLTIDPSTGVLHTSNSWGTEFQ